MGHVVGVLGGSGGCGASTFAAALASAAAPAVLVDADPVGGGIDVLLGIEATPGARWSGVRLDGGTLDPAVLVGGLPASGTVAVLAADVVPSPPAMVQVLDAAVVLGHVVVDLSRPPGALRDAAVGRCALVILVAVAELRELAAARAVLRSISPSPCAVGAVVRRGSVPVGDAAAMLGVSTLGVLPMLDRAARPTRALHRVAAGVLDGLVA